MCLFLSNVSAAQSHRQCLLLWIPPIPKLNMTSDEKDQFSTLINVCTTVSKQHRFHQLKSIGPCPYKFFALFPRTGCNISGRGKIKSLHITYELHLLLYLFL